MNRNYFRIPSLCNQWDEIRKNNKWITFVIKNPDPEQWAKSNIKPETLEKRIRFFDKLKNQKITMQIDQFYMNVDYRIGTLYFVYKNNKIDFRWIKIVENPTHKLYEKNNIKISPL